ncbi:hypothetical protein CAAN1_11S00584 [[Candida] anglica]|uniref:Exocyst complex component Sec3 PIP2-binding N-terminal domain-containing protein n=1 Tax=[Candida] anglica TaxID=148631 RepID=A0ABP0EIB1_9ASCO
MSYPRSNQPRPNGGSGGYGQDQSNSYNQYPPNSAPQGYGNAYPGSRSGVGGHRPPQQQYQGGGPPPPGSFPGPPQGGKIINGQGSPGQRYNAPVPPMDPVRKRKFETDKLIQDCFAKYIVDVQGRKVPEVSYQTHVNIKEFSSFPSYPPPEGTPPQQVGSIKDRVLVVCAKNSGRVMLQKGKFNEVKDAYQIGRTWDMDELRSIQRVGSNGIILTLNKDYYWRVEEGLERIWKFVRYLATSYGKFMGRYPELVGFSQQELKLADLTRAGSVGGSIGGGSGSGVGVGDIVLNELAPNPQILKSKSIKRKHLPNPVLPPQPESPMYEHYKDMDFTANGKLPMKPMMAMSVDRPGSSTAIDQQPVAEPQIQKDVGRSGKDIGSGSIKSTASKRHSHPYQTMSPRMSLDESRDGDLEVETTQDSSSFVFAASRNSADSEKSLQFSKEKASSIKGHKYQMSDDLYKDASSEFPPVSRYEFKQPSKRISLPKGIASPDFGIEEVEDDDEDEEEERAHVDEDDHFSDDQEQPLVLGRGSGSVSSVHRKERGLGFVGGISESSPEIIEESTHLDHEEHDTVSSSIQEIESFMESQLGNKGVKAGTASVRSFSSNNSDVQEVNSRGVPIGHESEVASSVNESDLGLGINKDGNIEKDPELEELLEEVNWNITEDSDALIKKLTKELNRVKYKNVEEVIALDFSNNTVSSDLTTSLKEIENLGHIFKKMEIDFQFLAPEVHSIETNSKGLQVKSVNKKLLYNDLRGILSNVSMDGSDLSTIEMFTSFDRLNKLDSLEEKLLGLYDALGAMRSEPGEDNDNFSSMKALKQYRANYEHVTSSFVKHFKDYLKEELKNISTLLSRDLERLSTHMLLRELNNLLIYAGFMFFVKDVSTSDFNELGEYFNMVLSDLFDKLLTQKLMYIKHTSLPSGNDFDSIQLKKRSLRMSTKTKFRLKGSDSPDTSHTSSNYAEQTTIEVQDSKAIIEVISFSKELVSIVQYFVGSMFHYDTNIIDFSEYIKHYPFSDRRRTLDTPNFNSTISYSNDIISNLTAIFGGYINMFMKKISPTETHIPLLLCYLENMLIENKTKNQEFLDFNFLKRALEKFKASWSKSIKSKVNAFNQSNIVAKCGILPSVKNFSQLLFVTESSLDSNVDLSQTSVRETLDDSYLQLTDAAIHLFLRDDPLLKNSEFDEKERHHRNVSILQNIFYLSEQISVFSSVGINKSKSSLASVFKKVENAYFRKLLQKNIGKLVEFVENYEALSNMGGQKKYNKKVVKSLLSNYTHKDIQLKATEIYRKLEKHFITGGDMFEKDLLQRLWKDMEIQFSDYFARLDKIIRANFEREIEYNVNQQEIRSIFSLIG